MVDLRRVLAACTALALVASAAAQKGPESVDLSPKWENGAEARYTYRAHSRTDRVPAMKAEQQQKTRQEMRIRRKVVSTGPEGTELELVFERIVVVAMSGKMFIRSDTNEPMDPERANSLDPVVRPAANKPIRVRLGPDSRVLAIENIPTGIDADGNPMRLVVDEELVRNSLAAMYSMEKSTPTARIGERWTTNETLPASESAELQIVHTRRLTAASESTATTESTAIADVRPIGTSATRPPLLVDFSCTTKHEWDHAAGRLRWMTLEQKVETHGVVRQMRSEHTTEVQIPSRSKAWRFRPSRIPRIGGAAS